MRIFPFDKTAVTEFFLAFFIASSMFWDVPSGPNQNYKRPPMKFVPEVPDVSYDEELPPDCKPSEAHEIIALIKNLFLNTRDCSGAYLAMGYDGNMRLILISDGDSFANSFENKAASIVISKNSQEFLALEGLFSADRLVKISEEDPDLALPGEGIIGVVPELNLHYRVDKTRRAVIRQSSCGLNDIEIFETGGVEIVPDEGAPVPYFPPQPQYC